MTVLHFPKFLICQFRPGAGGVLCEQPIGQGRGFGRVYPDRTNQLEIQVGTKYLCRRMHSTERRSHFVVPMKSAKELLKEFLPALTEAQWARGEHLTSDIATEITAPGYGHCKATWYQSTSGRFKTKFVTLKFTLEGENIEITVEHSEAPDEVSKLEKRVHECIGPIAGLGAAISRQLDIRRYA